MSKVGTYIQEAYDELLHKVSWPTWEELQGSALLVMITSLIIALIVASMDVTFKKLMTGIYEMFYH